MPSQQKIWKLCWVGQKLWLSRQKKFENYAESAKIMLRWQKICRVSKKIRNIMLSRQKLWWVGKKYTESAKILENYAESAKIMLSRQKLCRVSKKFENYAESAKIMVSRQKIWKVCWVRGKNICSPEVGQMSPEYVKCQSAKRKVGSKFMQSRMLKLCWSGWPRGHRKWVCWQRSPKCGQRSPEEVRFWKLPEVVQRSPDYVESWEGQSIKSQVQRWVGQRYTESVTNVTRIGSEVTGKYVSRSQQVVQRSPEVCQRSQKVDDRSPQVGQRSPKWVKAAGRGSKITGSGLKVTGSGLKVTRSGSKGHRKDVTPEVKGHRRWSKVIRNGS